MIMNINKSHLCKIFTLAISTLELQIQHFWVLGLGLHFVEKYEIMCPQTMLATWPLGLWIQD